MNMVDTKKCFRGVLVYREDVLKCARAGKKLSEVVRDLLHGAMKKYSLTEADQKELCRQIEKAFNSRKVKKAKRVLVEDRISIPAKVRKNPKFVKA